MGTTAHLVNSPGLSAEPQWIKSMYEAFESILGPKIMGTDPSGSERSESEIAIPKVIGIL